MCLQAMAIVYGRCHEEIGAFNDTRYIVGMLERVSAVVLSIVVLVMPTHELLKRMLIEQDLCAKRVNFQGNPFFKATKLQLNADSENIVLFRLRLLTAWRVKFVPSLSLSLSLSLLYRSTFLQRSK